MTREEVKGISREVKTIIELMFNSGEVKDTQRFHRVNEDIIIEINCERMPNAHVFSWDLYVLNRGVAVESYHPMRTGTEMKDFEDLDETLYMVLGD